MKKINTVTFHRANNYGAVLQAYALQEKLTNMGYQVKILDYRNKVLESNSKVIKIVSPKKGIKNFIKSVLSVPFFFNKSLKKLKAFSTFRNKYMKLTEQYTADKIKNNIEEPDVYICGSDQIWNSTITEGLDDIYTLNFGENAKKISYAASIGNRELLINNKNEYKEKLSKLNYISVREQNIEEDLEKLIDKDVQVVLDPVLLLDKNEWNKCLDNEKNRTEKEKYILSYSLQDSKEYREILTKLSNATGLKIINFDRRKKSNNILRVAYTDGPLEFVNLIKNAEYIVTTSFHATVFSILYNKKFFIVPHKQTGSRVTNLLDKLKITDRIYYSLDDFKRINYDFETDWENVEKILEQERQKSIDWLKNAIEG